MISWAFPTFHGRPAKLLKLESIQAYLSTMKQRPATVPQSLLIVLVVVVFGLALYNAPGFLAYSDQPVKSDAVVLFLGGEEGVREKEANQLMVEGYADFLIIPGYRQIKKRGSDGGLIKINLDLKIKSSKLEPGPQEDPNQRINETTNQKNRIIEDTHQEAIIAEDMMEHLGISTAILVSSPYHMRRIKLIAERVFGERAMVCYVPTRYETPDAGFWLFENYKRKIVITEYAKIAWFLLYSPFG
jgi:uncharacterized SAM-binding protein YcdF (DUF218 family)